MSSYARAEREVELAIDNINSIDSTYYEGCCRSALKALKSLCDDGHSGTSMSITANILDRLVKGLPLTAISADDTSWDSMMYDSTHTVYQCMRYPSLFKTVYSSRYTEYDDTARFVCIDAASGITYSNGFVKSIAKEYVEPIKMPYYPSALRIHIKVKDYLYSEENGDFDTIHIISIEEPGKDSLSVDRYFKQDINDCTWVEINRQQFNERIKSVYSRLAT